MFQNLKFEKLEKVYLTNDKPLEVEGKGDMSVKLASEGMFELRMSSSFLI